MIFSLDPIGPKCYGLDYAFNLLFTIWTAFLWHLHYRLDRRLTDRLTFQRCVPNFVGFLVIGSWSNLTRTRTHSVSKHPIFAPRSYSYSIFLPESFRTTLS